MDSMEQALREAAKSGHFGTVLAQTSLITKSAEEIKALRQTNSLLVMLLWSLVNRATDPVVVSGDELRAFDRARSTLKWHTDPSSGAITLEAALRDERREA
jgi:hypothetical protein